MRILSSSRPDCIRLGDVWVRLPGFLPAISGAQPLDRMVLPHLPRVSPLGQLLSYPSFFVVHEAPFAPPARTWIDGGSWGILRHGGAWRTQADGTAAIELRYPGRTVAVTPADLLAAQMRHAAVGFSLDIPVGADCPALEARRRLWASVENARFAAAARKNRESGFLLYAALPVVDDAAEFRRAVETVLALPVDGVALGSLAARWQEKEWEKSLEIIAQVRNMAGRLPLHVFGIGEMGRVRQAWEAGADTVDSSSPLRLALEGKLAGTPGVGIPDPSPLERMHLALVNTARMAAAPLGLDLASFLVSGRIVANAAPAAENTYGNAAWEHET